MKIKIIKFNDKFKMPEQGHYNDCGHDCFALEKVVIEPHKTKVVNLGFGLCMPDGFVGFLITKSSLAKKGIDTYMPPIDPGYRGEINAIIYNTTNQDYVFEQGDKIAQLVIMPVIYPEFVFDLGKERGENGFGSTGK